MQKFLFIIAILVIFFITSRTLAYSWGFFAHQRINQMAIFTLPPELIGFYKKNMDYISEHAVDPDKRRYSSKNEAQRHYIDLDHYGNQPFDSIPISWSRAVKKYTEDTLNTYGIVPWHIEKMMYRLTEAFKEGNKNKILHLSTELGHYIGDAHVPLHTTENYNGQLTNQKGIHGFWESRIPELKAEQYDYFVGRATYIDQPLITIWASIKTSFLAKDSVLLFEAQLNSTFPADKKYAFESRGKNQVKVYSKEYTDEYDKMLNGMVERRMRQAISAIGSFWYTAWVNAGQPDLDIIDNKGFTDSLKIIKEQEIQKEKEVKQKGHEDE